MNYPQKISKYFLDLIFPVKCIGCGLVNNGYICPPCLRSIEIKKTFQCIDCGFNVSLGQTCGLCRDRNQIDRLFVSTDYENPLVKKAIQSFKYKFIKELAHPLSEVMASYLKFLSRDKKFSLFTEDTLIIPMPLDKRRFNWRGFNQAELIANLLAEKYLIKASSNIVDRKFNKTHQADILDREKRLGNVKNIFKITKPEEIKNKRIILVDDVSTTGSTLNECARLLKDAGAIEVFGLVIARG
jgi:ComF family protein